MAKEFDDGRYTESYIFPKPEDFEREDPDTIRATRAGYGIDDF